MDETPTQQQQNKPSGLELIEQNPERYYLNKNGVVQDRVTGKFVACPPETVKTRITTENATELINERWRRAREAFSRGIVNARPSYKSDMDGIADIAKNMTITATGGQTKEAVMAAQMVMKYGDYVPDRRAGRPAGEETPDGIMFTGELAHKLLDYMRSQADRDG